MKKVRRNTGWTDESASTLLSAMAGTSDATKLSGYLHKSHKGSDARTEKRWFISDGFIVSYGRMIGSVFASTGKCTPCLPEPSTLTHVAYLTPPFLPPSPRRFDLQSVKSLSEPEPGVLVLELLDKPHPIRVCIVEDAAKEAPKWRKLWASAVDTTALSREMVEWRDESLAALFRPNAPKRSRAPKPQPTKAANTPAPKPVAMPAPKAAWHPPADFSVHFPETTTAASEAPAASTAAPAAAEPLVAAPPPAAALGDLISVDDDGGAVQSNSEPHPSPHWSKSAYRMPKVMMDPSLDATLNTTLDATFDATMDDLSSRTDRDAPSHRDPASLSEGRQPRLSEVAEVAIKEERVADALAAAENEEDKQAVKEVGLLCPRSRDIGQCAPAAVLATSPLGDARRL